MLKSGIYKIINAASNKCYIGSSKNICERINSHFRDLRKNEHCNKHLQNAWNRYGEDFFSFDVLLYCDEDDLIFYENRAIGAFNTLDSAKGYNCVPAKRTTLTGSNYTEFRKRSAKTQKRVMQSVEARERISRANKGRVLSEETRARMSKARKGKKRPEEHMAGMIAANKTRRPSQKTRELWSRQRKGKRTGAESPCAKATTANGILYPTVIAATKALGISKTTYYRRLRGRR